MNSIESAEPVFGIFKELNAVPRPSHNEGCVADWLCAFAAKHGLEHDRDSNNCVVIRKPASPGYEDREPVVILNHMDMVCVAEPGVAFNPLEDGIDSYVEDGWIKARGTSLGADNGLGLSMALAVLADDSISHPALEVLTTTNEEDGMSGACGLSPDFIRGRKVLNLDSEDYDTITVGAAGAYLQIHEIPFSASPAAPDRKYFRIGVTGGLGGHSGVDINKGRGNAIKLLFSFLADVSDDIDVSLSDVSGGSANASIASSAEAVVGVKPEDEERFRRLADEFAVAVSAEYGSTDADLCVVMAESARPSSVIDAAAASGLLCAIRAVPAGVTDPEGCGADETPVTSNNIGMLAMSDGVITVSTHTRSFFDSEMTALGESIRDAFNARTELVMSAPAWRESRDSEYIASVCSTFEDVLGFSPRKVEMHFVLEAGYYVSKYPGIQIACIGPRIVCPHSTGERAEISTVENIWKVVKAILAR